MGRGGSAGERVYFRVHGKCSEQSRKVLEEMSVGSIFPGFSVLLEGETLRELSPSCSPVSSGTRTGLRTVCLRAPSHRLGLHKCCWFHFTAHLEMWAPKCYRGLLGEK